MDRTPARVAVAYSGGRDSTALLHVTVRAARAQSLDVVALHVNHRLSAESDRWQSMAAATCSRWARAGAPLRFAARRLTSGPRAGESVEAWARRARYRALADMAKAEGAPLVLLAHHRGDQAETFLLQALRGAGAAGLAAMPRRIARDGVVWARPWLDVPRSAIEAYLRRHRLRFVEDDSNLDPRYARNRLRLQVMPPLGAAFVAAEAALARAASRAQEAAAALSELAEIDLAATTCEGGLDLQRWLALSPARRANVLRSWVRSASGQPAPATLVERLLIEWPAARESRRWPCAGDHVVARRGVLRVERARPAQHPAGETMLAIDAPGDYPVDGWAGRFEVRDATAGGVAWHRIATLRIVPRSGGERFQLGAGRPPRSLKKQFQSMGVGLPDRDGPIAYSGELLVYVAGLGIDARATAPAGEPQAVLRWVPDPPPVHR